MTSTRLSRALLTVIAGATILSLPMTASANEYPTLARVEYVEACALQFDRPRQELIYKCSCAIDNIASKVDYDTWIALETFNNAAPIAGERGAYIRERKDLRTHVQNYRELQSKARLACFLPAEAKQ